MKILKKVRFYLEVFKRLVFRQTEKDAKRLFPEELWNKLHLQIIFYGREYSPARSPKADKDYITRTIGTKKAIAELK